MKKIITKYLIVSCLIFILSIQGWYSLHYVTSCYHSRISNITISSDDPFFGDEQISADKNVTLHLTDQFSIQGLAHQYISKVFQTQVNLQIFDPNNTLIYSEMKYLPHKREVQFEFNNIKLSPHFFKLTGMYKIELSLMFIWEGIIKVSRINTVYFNLEREIVDLSCYFIDNIYLQTETTPYHHEFSIHGSTYEAGEDLPLIDEKVNIYFKESNGTDALVGEFYTNECGLINTNFIRYNTLHYDLMECYLIYEGNDIYKPGDSRDPSPFLIDSEGNKHIIKNANSATSSTHNLPDSFGQPSIITLSNKENKIWSPKGNDTDIEDWNFEINPFVNPNMNTIGFNGEKNQDGFDYWISAWTKQTEAGEKYLSLAFNPKEKKTVQQKIKGETNTANF